MTTRLLLLLAILLSAFKSFSQTSFHPVFTIAGGVERTVYWDMMCPHVAVEFSIPVGEYLNLDVGWGFTRKTSTKQSSEPVPQTIQTEEPYAHLLCSVFGNSKRNNLKLGLGFRQIVTTVDYSPLITIGKDHMLTVTRANYEFSRPAVNLVIQNDFRIFKNMVIGLQFDYNIYKNRETIQPIQIATTENNGFYIASSGVTSYPLSVFHGLIRLGYSF